jgi:hypothetical protein
MVNNNGVLYGSRENEAFNKLILLKTSRLSCGFTSNSQPDSSSLMDSQREYKGFLKAMTIDSPENRYS